MHEDAAGVFTYDLVSPVPRTHQYRMRPAPAMRGVPEKQLTADPDAYPCVDVVLLDQSNEMARLPPPSPGTLPPHRPLYPLCAVLFGISLFGSILYRVFVSCARVHGPPHVSLR